jgi:hypothetical protein
MNKLFTKRSGALLAVFLFISTVSFSQFKNVDFLKSAPADGAKFLQAYAAPWANAFGAGLNGGWYNTAKPHKLGGFDITTSFNVAMIPSSADKFDLSKIGLTSLTGTGTTSTISEPNTAGPDLTFKSGTTTLATFKAPPGTAWKIIPVPTAQVGIGLPFGTELKVRYIPKINIKDGDISLWGVGLVHSLLQYLPGNKLLPVDVSLFGGYTKLTGNNPLNLQPGTPLAYTTYNAATSFNNQNLNINVSALNVSLLASLNVPVLTVYGGIGYCKTKTEMAFSGNFPTPGLVTPALPAVPYAAYTDAAVITGDKFPKINIENFAGMRANIGIRIKLAVITIHADYTKAQYNVFSTGLGISFR